MTIAELKHDGSPSRSGGASRSVTVIKLEYGNLAEMTATLSRPPLPTLAVE